MPPPLPAGSVPVLAEPLIKRLLIRNTPVHSALSTEVAHPFPFIESKGTPLVFRPFAPQIVIEAACVVLGISCAPTSSPLTQIV